MSVLIVAMIRDMEKRRSAMGDEKKLEEATARWLAEQACARLDEAVTAVARIAQELDLELKLSATGECYIVSGDGCELVVELRKALTEWQDAGNAYIEAHIEHVNAKAVG